METTSLQQLALDVSNIDWVGVQSDCIQHNELLWGDSDIPEYPCIFNRLLGLPPAHAIRLLLAVIEAQKLTSEFTDEQSPFSDMLKFPLLDQRINRYKVQESIPFAGEILAELKRAEAKHSWENNPIERNALILSEEAGEVSRAVLRHVEEGKPISEVREELIQTGAMVFRFLKNLPEG